MCLLKKKYLHEIITEELWTFSLNQFHFYLNICNCNNFNLQFDFWHLQNHTNILPHEWWFPQNENHRFSKSTVSPKCFLYCYLTQGSKLNSNLEMVCYSISIIFFVYFCLLCSSLLENSNKTARKRRLTFLYTVIVL